MGPSKRKTAGNSSKDDIAKKIPTAKDKEEPAELSEEDKQLQEELNSLVAKLMQEDVAQYQPALESLCSLIMASTTSMTSVPKPLKFLRPHYPALKRVYELIQDKTVKQMCGDVISVLAMAVSSNRDCLKYRLLGTNCAIGDWGHEYVRHLSGEVAAEWAEVVPGSSAKLMELVMQIVPYNMAHNAEAEACDLLMEIDHIELLDQFVDESAFPRVCLYLTSCVPYVADPDNTTLLHATLTILRRFKQHALALRVAMQLNDVNLISEIFTSCPDLSVQKQLAFMLGRQQVFLELNEDTVEASDKLVEIMANTNMSDYFLCLAREFDILEPKTPEDVYKSHLVHSRQPFGSGKVDSARQNLAASFVNGFVNCGFGRDKLLMEDGNKWLYKNKEHGMLSAMASMGLVLLWDVDGGLGPIDKYLYCSEEFIKAGALLACGIVNCGVRNECDPALALLSDYVHASSNIIKIGAIVGLGLAYAGSNKPEVLALVTPLLAHPSMEVAGMAALACGMVAVGSCNAGVTSDIVQALMEHSESNLKDTFSRFLPLGLGLCHLGKQESVDVVLVALDVLAEPFKSMTKTLVEVCAYAGTGNVLKVQKMLHICSEHYEPPQKLQEDDKNEKKDEEEKVEKNEEVEIDLSSTQAIAVLGVALISMGEDISIDMALRTFGNLLRYCEPVTRRAVPLALGLVSVSNPRLNILDMLSKFSHDSDCHVAHNAIFAMGLVGAGSNNARLAVMLRLLAQFHAKDPNHLFMVRLAQGLTHLGKGMLTLSPFHSDRQLLNPVALSGILATLVGFLDVKNIILGKSHYLIFSLAAAMQPRMLVTLDEELNRLAVPVRVGMAVDVVGQAGTPKTITGFQTHKTPVLLGFGERAELATEEYTPLTPIMEGFVILRKKSGSELSAV